MIEIREGRSDHPDARWRQGNTITVFFGFSGIRSKGHESTDLWLMLLEARGFYTCDLKMKTRGTFTADWNRFKDGQKAAMGIAEVTNKLHAEHPGKLIRVVLLGHSYGGVKVGIALDLLDAWDLRAPVLSVFVRPAMDSDWTFPEGTNLVCWYHPKDGPLRLGKKLKFNHVFGDAGLKGFNGRPKVLSQNKQHSADFTTPYIHDLVEGTLSRAFPLQTVPRVDT